MPKRCDHSDCSKRPSYGLEPKKATHCSKHASATMFNVRSKRCVHSDCSTMPSYGTEPMKATHCQKHASATMFDVKHKRCVHSDCSTRPSYGLKPKKATHCSKHASEAMYDVINKRCVHSDCSKIPNFGLKPKKATHCSKHAIEAMYDVKSKRCVHSDCSKQPNFGLEPKKATHCSKHASEAMYDVRHKRCVHSDCSTRPSYGLEPKKPTHCQKHASEAMFDVRHKRCGTCDATRVNHKYNPNCARCHFYLNPNDPRIRNYKTKEHAFMYPLRELYPDIILDKVVAGGCSRRRPDGLIDCFTHSIIIEIDEDQHVGYESICDNRRTMELFTDLGSRPIVFIRLNPDSYKINGKRIRGCFTLDKKSNELKVNVKELALRSGMLREAIDQSMKAKPLRSVMSIKLFYSDE